MNNLNDHQTQNPKCLYFMDLNIQHVIGFKLSNDSNYIAIFTKIKNQQNQDELSIQISIYLTQSCQCLITFQIQQLYQNSNIVCFSNNSSYFYYYTNYNCLNLLNLKDLTFKKISTLIQSEQNKHYFINNKLLIKDELTLHIYNIQSQSKLEQLRFGFQFSHFTTISENLYFLVNNTKSTLELWANYYNYFKNKISKQFKNKPSRIVFMKNNLILCAYIFKSIQFLAQTNFNILRNITLRQYFINQQLYFEDKISLVKIEKTNLILEIINFFPNISKEYIQLEQDILEQFYVYEQTSKLILGLYQENQNNLKMKIYKLFI